MTTKSHIIDASSTVVPFRKPSLAQLTCVKCGAETDAACNCGVEYKPAAARAAEAIAANPEKSNRAIAADIGVSEPTVRRARKSTASPDAVAKRIGKDGKVRKLPAVKLASDAEALAFLKAPLRVQAERIERELADEHDPEVYGPIITKMVFLQGVLRVLGDLGVSPEAEPEDRDWIALVPADDETIDAAKLAADAWQAVYQGLLQRRRKS